MAAPRRRRIGHRRRVEDEGDDDARTDALDLDDESLSDGSLLTDDIDAGEDSDTSNIDEASPTSPDAKKSANGAPKTASRQPAGQDAQQASSNAVSDTDAMLHGLSIADKPAPAQAMHFDDVVVSPPKSPSAPIIVSSASAPRPQPASQVDRRRQEHEDYKRRRDEDPAFVPNRGSFFMHDHRHAGPAANGFRPFGRGRGRVAAAEPSSAAPFLPFNNHMHHPSDPTTNSPWTHDMHEAVADPIPRRPRQIHNQSEGPPNGNGIIPTCEPSATPINRTLSTEKHIGNAQVRVFLPRMKVPAVFPGMPVKQYTKLPDHRPPLRRDKPVRISLPNHPPRYIFPAPDRSFTFIPRALRPNQQRMRGKPRSTWGGSVGGYSRRTSVFGGGSYYAGSVYSPSVAMSRRSSIVHERDMMFSPTGSVMSRPPMPADAARPVVRLPPAPGPDMQMQMPGQPVEPLPQHGTPIAVQEASITDLPQPQTHPLPQKPAVHENRPASLPMHQPRPQKNISVADIEPPALLQGPQAFQQPFHQQVPVQVANGLGQDAHGHARRPSYPSHHSTGTPLSQIPERAIHAAPFQPNAYNQPPYYNQVYQPQGQAQQGYYYPPGYSGPAMGTTAAAPPFVPAAEHGSYTPQNQAEQAPQGGMPGPTSLVAQEVNGMVYYYDTSQMQPVGSYPPYSAPQAFQPSVMGMGGMVTPSPDAFYYPQQAPGMMYYPQ
ncbi:hypothetical protein ACCO45_013125 [Purpureocillium lilacinum]|uniref:Uncharacterized protein n=1 Tax=Purpureocillium lilacinum TaxID=33203 RepID=A0ACC4DA25_PURLI